MLRFQELMAKFLDTQKSVMASYLQGGPAPTVEKAEPVPAVSSPADVSPSTPAPEPPGPPAAGGNGYAGLGSGSRGF